MKYLLGIDFGGGASKATLLTHDGKIAAEHSVEYPTLHPEAGACEQSPSDWVRALYENISALLRSSKIDPSDITAVAVDSATHTFLPCDEGFSPLYNAIHWTDSRSVSQARALRESHGERIFELTYHKPDTVWTLPQLVWLKENRPDVFEKTRYIFFEKDYIRYLLTDVYCTDFIEAQGSMLFDTAAGEWSDELCALAGINAAMLPPVVRSTDTVGSITKSASELTGLCEGTPVICGTTDTVMEVLAAGATYLGATTVKLATAGRICVITDKPVPDRDVVNYSHVKDGLWYPGSATKAAASSFRWYRDTFGGDYRELDEGAENAPVGCDGLMFHPYINGELTPYADPKLCGSFIGIRSTHQKGHFTRSVLEGVAFSLLHSKEKLLSLGVPCSKQATLIGGGAKSKLWSQIVADCLDMELVVTESSDSSLGSAMLAGVATGVFASFDEAVEKCIHIKHRVTPNPENTKKYNEIFKEYVRVHDALAPIYDAR